MESRKSSIFAQLLCMYDARETKVSYLHWFIKKMNNNPQTHPNKISNNKQNMKNTMKIKSLLSFFVPAAMLSLGVASCSDYDNGYDTNAIKFTEQFRKTFGDVDPDQDWNLAERGTVTVSTMKESEVKIYAFVGGEYCIVGDYEGVKGTQMLSFDMVEGTTSIMVTDGETAQQTVPGGVVTFGSTRTVYGGNNDVKIEELGDAGYTDANGVKFDRWKEATSANYDAMKAIIPESGGSSGNNHYTNLNRVTHDFAYVSTGEFIIYPYYWETSSENTIGLYYGEGNNYHEVDIYTIKQGDELQYYQSGQTERKGLSWANATGTAATFDESGNTTANLANVTAGAFVYRGYKAFTWISPTYNLVQNLGFGTENYTQYDKFVIDCELKGNTPGIRVLFYKGDNDSKALTINSSGKHEYTKAKLIEDLGGDQSYLTNCTKVVLAGSTIDSNGTFQGSDYWANGKKEVLGDAYIKEMYFEKNGGALGWHNFSDPNNGNSSDVWFCSEIFTRLGAQKVRGQGIKVDIPEGTRFGMYLKKGNPNNPTHIFYSEGSKNTNYGSHGYGVIDNGNGTITQTNYLNPCYASTFHVGDQMFLGFEDWPNNLQQSDFDLNDVVVGFSGSRPIIINEDPTPASTWLLACEDLGGSFDIDYNDVVFMVEHVSGQEFARLKALAAGGTLASYIYFRNPQNPTEEKCFGEIHQLFGASPQRSGEYDIINARGNRAEKDGPSIDFKVAKDWSMAYYSTGETGGTNYGQTVNMGGFELRTLVSGAESPFTLAIGSPAFTGASRVQAPGDDENNVNVPFIICLPYYYTRDNMNGFESQNGKQTKYVWSWPTECVKITSPYPNFYGWVADHNSNQDWYKIKSANGATVSDLYWVTDMNNTQQVVNISASNANTTVNTSVHLRNYVTTNSDGAITFKINGVQVDENYTPTAAGTYTVSVIQAANGVYAGGSTEFNLIVAEGSTGTGTGDAEFGIQASIAENARGETNNWNDRNNHTVYLVDGQKLTLSPYKKWDASANVIVKAFDNGGTGITIDKTIGAIVTGNIVVTVPSMVMQAGIASITLCYPGDSQYATKDITYTIQVSSASKYVLQVQSGGQAVKNDNGELSAVTGFYLTKDGDRLKLNQYTQEVWVFEQVPDNTEYYYIYHVNSGMYLCISDANAYSPAFQKAVPANKDKGMFKIEGGKIRCKFHANRYIGNDADWYVYINKEGNSVITWTMNSVNYAKQRNAKKR